MLIIRFFVSTLQFFLFLSVLIYTKMKLVFVTYISFLVGYLVEKQPRAFTVSGAVFLFTIISYLNFRLKD